MPVEQIKLLHAFGVDSYRRNNLVYMEPGVLLYIIGNTIVLQNLETLEQSYLPGVDGTGLGCLCVHPSKKYFAVGSIGNRPNVNIYEYPSLKLFKVLRNGTESGYAAMKWGPDGSQLATVGMFPDFMLTVWDWTKELVVLRAKAFAQDIFNVSFSPYLAGILTTCGTGHIRFWKMASTFTGLKLQGEIGKFGKVEISDVAGYLEFEDGKVLSGTETGDLLVWTSAQIKAIIYRPGKKPCHDGMIETVELIKVGKKDQPIIVTAATDGYVKFWDFYTLDSADPEEGLDYVEVTPLQEIKFGGCKIKNVLYLNDFWIVQDQNGSIAKYDIKWNEATTTEVEIQSSTKISEFHSGAIVSVDCLPLSHHAVTGGADGSIRLYDLKTKEQMLISTFNTGVSCMTVLRASADPSGKTVIAGFEDGVIRTLIRCEDAWKLVGVSKPHKEAVSVMELSPDGKTLATTSNDKTIFFLSGTEGVNYKPIGYIVIDCNVTSMAWSTDSSKLLVGQEDGSVSEYNKEDLAKVDTSGTYEIELPSKLYEFKKPVPKKEEPEGEGQDGGTPADGLGEPEPAADEKEEEEEEEEEAIYPVASLLYKSDGSGQFYLAFGDGSGVVYECKFGEPEVLTSFESLVTLTEATYSISEDYLLTFGPEDMRISSSTTAEKKFWSTNLHNSQLGAITSVSLSHDNTLLITSGKDGSLFVQEFTGGQVKTDLAEALAQPVKEALEITPYVIDITDEGHYTIEEAKQKTEEDNLEAAAEKTKQGLRDQIKALQAEFEALLQENKSRPENERLPREAFEIDPDLKAMIQKETEDRVELARKELEWDLEKAKVALEKMKVRFLDEVETQRIVLYAFRSGKRVSAFRTRKFPANIKAEIDKFHAQEEIEAVEAAKEGKAKGGRTGGAASPLKSARRSGETKGGAADEDEDSENLTKQEIRRLQRKKREEEWTEFNKRKPDETYENPDDVAAIQEAVSNMGDFKLKSDPDYIVPENQRVNAEKKRTQMLMLEESVHNIKMEFNKRFLALRDVKKRINSDVNSTFERIRMINQVLEVEEELVNMELKEDEYPEKRLEISEEDVVSFAARQNGGKGAGAGAAEDKKAQKASKGAPAKAPTKVALSELEITEKEIQRQRLQYEKDKLLKQVDYMLNTFDDALNTLRQEKFQLEADMKSTDMKRLILYKELVLLKEFEKQDLNLKRKLENKVNEENDVQVKVNECQDKLQSKREEIEKVMEKKAAVAQEFDGMVEETNSFREALLKIFLRKIKRIKRKAKDMADYDSEEEEESESDEDDDDFDDDDDIEEVCPPGCDQTLYEKVCDLREKRLDQEDLISDIQKQTDTLKKEKDALNKKHKMVESSLKAINKDIVEFQKEKQGKLNEIDVIVTLKMHQVEYIVDGQLPADRSEGLVFSRKALQGLHDRVQGLIQEKAALRRQQKELRKEHVQLNRDKRAKEAKIVELEKKAKDVQMLKFGQIIDLDVLDRLGTNKGSEDLKETLKKQEAQQNRELKDWDRKIEVAVQRLASLTHENTFHLNQISELTAKQKMLEKKISSTKSNLFTNPAEIKRKENAERDHLVQIVNSQARDIQQLKSEINLLRRKGGR